MKTLKSKISMQGRGLMSNAPVTFEIEPSDKKGIRFHVQDGIIEAKLENVAATDHCVVLADIQAGGKHKVALVEHFMASCAICGIEALDVKVQSEGFETPIFDGSAKVWVEKFKETGFTGEETPTSPLDTPVIFQAGKSSVVVIPADKTTITYSVNYNHPDLKNRWVTLNLDENLQEIIEARTFGFLKDLETFQKMGFSKGVTIDNTVGLTDTGYTVDLRSEFEPVKHKILDIIGDFYLTGVNPLKLNAAILVKEAGHGYHVEAARALKKVLK